MLSLLHQDREAVAQSAVKQRTIASEVGLALRNATERVFGRDIDRR